MASKQYSLQQIVAKLRQIDVLVGEGKSIHEACKEASITDVTYYARVARSRTCSDQPETARLGTGGGYAVKCVNEPGTKTQSGHSLRLFMRKT